MKPYKPLYIAVDFDGTIVTHEYPRIGQPVPNCIPTLLALQHMGHKIILYTMRSGAQLEEAVQYLKDNRITPYGVNENPSQKSWTQSPKVYAHIYIDDAALGTPLVYNKDVCDRPWVDWFKIWQELSAKVII
jgi:hydroxymethylpyrimidine pyrophosphatase-like HAD family hydrolase